RYGARLGGLACGLVMWGAAAWGSAIDTDVVFGQIDARLRALVAETEAASAVAGSLRYPESRPGDEATWRSRGAGRWTGGFLPGALWQMYGRSGDPSYRAWAERWTMGLVGKLPGEAVTAAELAAFDFSPGDHDVGFVYNESFGRGYALTGDATYRAVRDEAAARLDARFDAGYGAMRSWDWGTWNEVVIIDHMMNLELLFDAAADGGPAGYVDRAVAHALTTADYHVRSDGSTYHVVEFGFEQPEVGTWQGLETESTWARGQAWALHGYANVARQATEAEVDPAMVGELLSVTTRVADYFVDNLPDDGVPYWDFELPEGEPALLARDTSAAAIAASGLIDLAEQVADPEQSERYFAAAEGLLVALLEPAYFAVDAPGETRILLQGIGRHPAARGGSIAEAVPTSLIYADHYFIEALIRYEDAIFRDSRAATAQVVLPEPGAVVLMMAMGLWAATWHRSSSPWA
ncbi:MAG: hypothetical protein AAF078_13065, partial [Planctomycetota bacterium]